MAENNHLYLIFKKKIQIVRMETRIRRSPTMNVVSNVIVFYVVFCA